VIDLLDRKPEIQDLPNAVPAPAFRGAIQFKGVNFVYEPESIVLQDINFEVQPGQCIALVGPSGAGKSTIASLILRLYDPTAGKVMIDGRDIRTYRLESLRRQISVVMQDSLLFAASIRDNIAIWERESVRPDAIEVAARLANAHDFIMALPDGYDTIIGERGVTFSGGERQRIAIARACHPECPDPNPG
jgi:ATP-binding cassette, subfamily B, bacterial